MARKHQLGEQRVTLTEPFLTLDVSVTWARTLPSQMARETARIGQGDAPILRELGRSFRNREPRRDVQVTSSLGSVGVSCPAVQEPAPREDEQRS